MDGFLGTSAPGTSDLTLLAYVLILVPGMLVGFFFARRKMFVPYHKVTMTLITLANWLLIIFVMAASYSGYFSYVSEGGTGGGGLLVPSVHLLLGGSAQLLATYLVLMMWTENTRFSFLAPFRFRNIKLPMRLTLTLWLATVAFGLVTYVSFYGAPASAADTPAPQESQSPDDAGGESVVPAPGATEEPGA